MKKSIWTKLLVLVLSATIAVTMTPAFAFANDGEAQDQVVTETSGATEEDVDATEAEGKLQEDAATEDEGNLPEEDSALDLAGDSANDIPDSGEIMQTQEAGDPAVSYYDMDGKQTTLEGNEYTKISTASSTTLSSGFYVVDKSWEISNRVTISGDVKLILIDGTTLTCSKGITVTGSNNLEIYAQSTGDNAGKLIAKGEKYNSGIGGTDNGYGGTVTICGGTVNATGGEFGAGIGSGDEPGSDAAVMTVNIKGGNVTATGGDEAAGIGGGNEGNGATVNISGGTVIANGGNDDYGLGAGIGGGDEGNGGEVTISGGTVEATGGNAAAGIGGGEGGDGGNVTISGGKVTAKGGYRAAGIGGGADGSNTKVTITGGEVHAYGGGVKTGSLDESGGAGIGGGGKGYGGVIIIKGGDVEVRGFRGGAGLGGGYGGSVTTVAISGDETKVSAGSDSGGAGIGGGYGGDAYNIGISGGNIEAYSESQYTDAGGAAIGSGHKGYAANISISDGTIRAVNGEGNHGAAAIGGGNKGYFGNIRIEGGTITSAHAYGGGAGIGSGSESEKKSEQPVGKITISGGTIRSGSTASYSYNSTGAGIGSGSFAVSPVNIEISGGTIDAYCGMDDGSTPKMSKSGAGIGTGYGSQIGAINITGGTIMARRGTGCTAADPIGYFDNEQDTPYSQIKLNYNNAQIRNEKGKGTDKRVTNTQYDSSDTNLNRIRALIDHETDWVEIKPCDHVDATYEIVSAGEDGKHKIICDYCLDSAATEHTHEFDSDNKCICGYYRYKLTFKDGQSGGDSKDSYVYPDVSTAGEVIQNKLIILKNYAPTFVLAGKKFAGWKTDSDPTGNVYTYDYVVKGDTTFVAQWTDFSGVTIVLSSIDGPLEVHQVGNQSSDTKLDDLLADSDVAEALSNLAGQHNGYVLGTERGSKAMTSASSMAAFNDLSGSDKTVGDLQNGMLYLAMLKEIDEVEFDVEAPVCGTTIIKSGEFPPYNQNPRPVVTPAGDTYEIGERQKIWVNNPTDPPGSYPSGNIDIKGGMTYYFSVIANPIYGYAFKPDATKINLTGGAKVAPDLVSSITNYEIKFNAQIKGVHDFGEWNQTKDPTCTEKGEKTRTCSKCSYEEPEEIPALDHDWGEATYEWAADKSTCTATRVCKRDDSHVETETVNTTSEVTKEATKDEEGVKTYTASFTNPAFEEQTATEAIPKKGSDVDPTPTPAPSTQAKTILVAKGIASGKKALKISWNNVGADRYVIYMSKCNYKGKKYKQKAVKTVSGKTFKWTKKKLKKKTCYKFYVVAQKKTASGYTTIAVSEEGHAITGNRRGKATNPKSLKLKQTAITLNKGGSANIKATVKKAKKGKKLLTTHEPLLRYISNNPAVATVAANGKVTAKSSGTAVIYVQTINGIWKTAKVTVR